MGTRVAGSARDEDRFARAEAALWASVGVEPTERWCTLDGGTRVRIQEVGEGPPVLFVHGASVAGSTWATLAARLTDHRCLLLDRPGCGRSEPGPRVRSLTGALAEAGRTVPRALDALGLERAAVVATSLGGLHAFRGAAAVPDRVTHLVELGWTMGAPGEKLAWSMRVAAVPGLGALGAAMPATPATVRAMLRPVGLARAIDSGAFDDRHVEWMVALLNGTDTMRNERHSAPRPIRPLRGHDPRAELDEDLLARVTMPVLLLWGDEDPNGSPAVARAFADRLPDADLRILEQAGHAPWLDRLDTCVDAIRTFLAT